MEGRLHLFLSASLWHRWTRPCQPGPSPALWAPSPALDPHHSLPLQRRAGPSLGNSPTVAVMPGKKRSSQNLLRKDVFPTAESPTNTTLKIRSGVRGQPSSCGRQTVYQLLRWSPAMLLPQPASTHPQRAQGWGSSLQTHTREATAASVAGNFELRQTGKRDDRHSMLHSPTLICPLHCWPCAGQPGGRPGLRWSEEAGKQIISAQ